ncbi:hypothetical protein J3R30DRAFT_3702623 [Lentinula aciculospora]|uniref:BTB domain-containing protein n=1 Tax=Lentinula aciculospora TaxID=153920 RepID=A0A9W9DP29_9AGAR|nr:hypothetical protein J3R30DRAFT_3702623 [Lentinula aciculospora]
MTSGIGTLLHAHFHLRNQQAFQRLLSSSNTSSGSGDTACLGGLSIGSSPRSLKTKASREDDRIDVNGRDRLGRTVLHIASASIDASSVEYVRLLLKHPEINVNLHDWESQWTALHRAMYVGNLGVVLLLLQHFNTDATLKDLEGYTAFDLYNSTVEGTRPEPFSFPVTSTLSPLQSLNGAELFTWGANRNASLGQGDSSDRTFPDHVPVPSSALQSSDHVPVEDRFARIGVRQVKMGRLHTGVISDPPSNGSSGSTLSLCGFGSGGRLGVTQHTQYALKPLSWAAASQAQFTPAKALSQPRVKVISVALGQDHTLALTENGEIYSWGLNRFSQLGYNIDDGSSVAQVFSLDDPSKFIPQSNSTISPNGEQIQLIPRRVYGLLKKEFVLGIVASKGASACWVREGTDGAGGGSNVYTWGLNGGHLGYDRIITGSGAHVQVVPRKVTKINRPVVQIALGESAMACLLSGVGSVGGGWKGDVLVFWGDLVGRVSFPINAFPLPMTPYRPPQALKSTRIVKIVCSDESPPPFSLSSISASSAASTNAQHSHASASSLSAMINAQANTMNTNQNHINFACVSEGGEVFTFGVPGVPPVGVFNSGSMDIDTDGTGGSAMALAKIIKPQRVWALRRGLVGAVRDIAIGVEGSLIVCTDSGHVYVRTRSSDTNYGGGSKSSSGGGKSQRFIRIPYLQRIVGVCASSTGTFGALRVDADVKTIRWPIVDEELLVKKDGRGLKQIVDALKGWDLTHDMKRIRPWMWKKSVDSPLDVERLEDYSEAGPGLDLASSKINDMPVHMPEHKPDDDADEYDDDGDLDIMQDIKLLRELCAFVEKQGKDNLGFWAEDLPYGADLMAYIHFVPSVASTKKGRSKSKAFSSSLPPFFPLHTVLLGARSKTMTSAFSSPSESIFECKADPRSTGLLHTIAISPLIPRGRSSSALRNITFTNFHPLTVLILMHYVYTDGLICIWDRRVSTGVPSTSSMEALRVTPALAMQIKSELQALAEMLVLPEMQKAMESVVKRPVTETLQANLAAAWTLYNSSSPSSSFLPSSGLDPNIVLQLAEGREYLAHSTILRARSVYFEDFLSEDDWTRNRKANGELLRIDLRHMKSDVMEYVMKWLCCGQTKGLFGSLDFAQSVDAVLEFLFEVIAVANELLLFPLVLLTSKLILKFLNIHNACYILSEASHYHAYELVTSVESYISENLETFLETHMLDVLTPSLIKHLSVYIRTRQEAKASVVRSNKLVNHAMNKWQEWLANEDIPTVFVPSAGSLRRQRERKLSQVAKISSPASSSPILSTSFGQRDIGKITPSSPVSRSRTNASPGLKPQAPILEADDIFDMDDMDIGLPSLEPVELQPPANQLSSRPSPAWKASSVPRVDMRSVMAEAAIASEPQPKSTQVHPVAAFASDRSSSNSIRLRRAGSALDMSTTPSTSPRPSGSWKVPHAPNSDSPAPNPFPTLGSSGSPTPASKLKDTATPSNARLPLPTPSSGSASGPALGPKFSPSRQPAQKAQASAPRRVSSTSVKSTPKAWISTPVHESLPPTITNTNRKGVSFVAIQQYQLEQGTSNLKDKRSLLEIQQEEQAKQEEEDFLKWWNAEEERVRLETEAMERMQSSNDKGRQGGKSQNQKNHQKRTKKSNKATNIKKLDNNSGRPAESPGSSSRAHPVDSHPPRPSSNFRQGPRGKKGGPASAS